MRVLLLTATLATSMISFASAADACSARGRYCGYPAWAANAFEDASGRRPDAETRKPAWANKLKTR